MEKNKIISQNQHGFRQYRSTYDYLLTLETNICEAFSENHHLVAIFLDIEKAYDMIWKQRIIKILLSTGITGNMIKFVHNFLKHRFIRVRANGTLSDIFEIENGVPQGSVPQVLRYLF